MWRIKAVQCYPTTASDGAAASAAVQVTRGCEMLVDERRQSLKGLFAMRYMDGKGRAEKGTKRQLFLNCWQGSDLKLE